MANDKLIETWFGLVCVRIKVPVLHDPELVEVLQAENPDGVMILSKSKVAGPAVSKAVIGNDVAISLIVPVAPKSGSTPDTRSAVTPVHGDTVPEKAMQGFAPFIATTFPATLLRFSTPPPPSGIGVANAFVEASAMTAITIGSELFIIFILSSSVSCLLGI